MAISGDSSPAATFSAAPNNSTVFFARSSFLARSLVSAILRSGSPTVRLVDLDEPNLSFPDPIHPDRTSSFRFDPSNPPETLAAAVAGSSAVFLFDPTLGARPPPSDADPVRLYSITVLAAKRVVSACRAAGVRRLVYTGSADVMIGGTGEVLGGNISMRYADRFFGVLDEFRLQVERIVSKSDGKDGLSTCVLRVCNPFGPGDEFLVPFFVRHAKSRWAKFIIGSGQNMCDFTYVENIAHANICAERALESEKASVGGKPFFITNHEPVYMWEFISDILEGLGYQRPIIQLHAKFVLLGAMLLEWISEKSGFGKICCPDFSPAIIHMLSCTRTFDFFKAQKVIGYSPIVSLQEAVRLTVDSFCPQLAAECTSQRDFTRLSKAEKLLGSGSVGSLLLWRDEKKTFSYAMTLFFFYYWFILSGRTFISSFAKLFLLATIILYGHSFVPASKLGHTSEKMSSFDFEVSELAMRNLFVTTSSFWNKGVRILNKLAQGNDWNLLIKAIGSIFLVKLLFSCSLSLLIGVGLTSAFTLFAVYDQYEQELENGVAASIVGVRNLKDILINRFHNSLAVYVDRN